MKRTLRWCCVLAAVLIGLSVAAYALRSEILAPRIARALVAAVAEQTGMVLGIGAVGGSYLADLTLADVHTVTPASRGPVRTAAVGELRVVYNPLALLSGTDAFLASVRVELSRARVELDQGADAAEGVEGAAAAEASGPLWLPGVLPVVQVRDSSVLVKGPDYHAELSGIALDVQSRRGAPTSIRATIAELAWEHPVLRPGAVTVAAELEYSPHRLILQSLTVNGRPLVEGVRVGLDELPRGVPVNGKLRVFGGEADLRVHADPLRLDGRLALSNLDLEEADGLLRRPPLDLAGRLFADVSVQLDWKHPELLTASLTARLEDGAVENVKVESLTLEASAAGGQGRVASLRARLGNNEAEIRDAEIPLSPALAGDLAVLLAQGGGDFRAEIRDLGGILSLVRTERAAVAPPEHRLTLAGRVAGGRLEVAELLGSSPANSIEVREVSVPLQDLIGGGMETLVRSSRGRFRVDLRDIPSLVVLAGLETGHSDRPTPGHRLLLAGALGSGRVEMTEGRLTAEGAEIRLDRGRLDLPTASELAWSGAGLAAHLTADVPDLGALLSLIGEPEGAGSLSGQLSVAGTVGSPRGSIQFTGRKLAWRDLPLGTASLEAAVDPEQFKVIGLSLDRGTDHVAGHGVYGLKDGRMGGVVLDLSIANVGFYTRSLAPSLGLSGGRVIARVEAAGSPQAPIGHLSLRASGASIVGVAVEQLDVQAQTDGARVRLDEVVLRTSEGELALSGEGMLQARDGSFQGVLESLRLARAGLQLSLQAPSHIAVRGSGGVTVDSLALAGPLGAVELRGDFDPKGDSDLTLQVSDFAGHGWLETLVGDRVSFRGADLHARLTGAVAHPMVAATAEVAELRVEGAPFPLRGGLDLLYGPGGVSIRRLELQGDLGTGVSATGEIPYDPLADPSLLTGPLALRATADVPSLGPLVALVAPEVRIDGFLKGSVDLQGTWAAPRGRVRLVGSDLTLPATWQPRPDSPLALECAITLGGDRVELETLRVRSAELIASAAGSWTGALPLAQLLRGETGVFSGDLSVRGNVEVPDIRWLARDLEPVRRLGGSARGEFSVQGPVADPTVTAALELADAELLVNGPIPGIRALSGRITADRTRVRLERMGGELGGAPFHVSGQVDRDGTGEIRPDLHLEGKDLLLYRNDGVKLRADADLRITGALSALEIAGALAITDGRFVKNVDFLSLLQGTSPPRVQGGLQLFSFPDPPLRDARLDLAITAAAPFQIKNNLVKGEVRPDLRITGTGEIPVVLGKVYVDATRVRLPAGRLVVESGVVQFLPSDPDRPRLDLLARAKMIGYDVTLQLSGPYDEPVVTLSSNPPLADEDLVLLVFAGVPPRSPAGEGAARQSGMMMATYLGRAMLGQALGEESTESGESVLDRFDLVIGQGVTQKGEETIEASFRLKENVLRDSDALYLRSEKDVYDAYNVGLRIVFRFE